MLLVLLIACAKDAITSLETEVSDIEDDVATHQLSVDERLAALEARVAASEAALTAAQGEIAILGAALDELRGANDDVVLNVAELEAAVLELQNGGGGGFSTSVATQAAATEGYFNYWSSITASPVSITLSQAGTIVGWCSALDSRSAGAYRISVEASDGSWSETGEAVGDGSVAIGQNTESITVMGAFDAPAPGVYLVSCEGYSAQATDITLIAIAGS